MHYFNPDNLEGEIWTPKSEKTPPQEDTRAEIESLSTLWDEEILEALELMEG